MPPAVIAVVLIGIGVPAAMRAILGRPQGLPGAWVASLVAVLVAQALGELGGVRSGVAGDAQVALALVGAALASGGVAIAETRRRRR
ncbi:MAG: hypothetical protein M3Q61_04950 [Chloroflexota bacterium]|nr:hypothetical protein [Chloroflexota bacterium]